MYVSLILNKYLHSAGWGQWGELRAWTSYRHTLHSSLTEISDYAAVSEWVGGVERLRYRETYHKTDSRGDTHWNKPYICSPVSGLANSSFMSVFFIFVDS